VANDAAQDGLVGLPEAIESLRADLTLAWRNGLADTVRFKAETVELTLQLGVTRTGKGSAGVKWHVLTLGGERSREVTATQTLRLVLAPLLFDEQGNERPAEEQLIADGDSRQGKADIPMQEPE
jgi:Trypsin-co-occurring domain 2